MENNQLQKLDKKLFIKQTLINIAGAIAIGLFLVFIAYGRQAPIKTTFIVMGFMIVLMLIVSIFAFKYPPHKIGMTADKFRKIFLILGILMVIVNLALIIIEGGTTNYYLGVALGLYFISGPNIGKPKSRKINLE